VTDDSPPEASEGSTDRPDLPPLLGIVGGLLLALGLAYGLGSGIGTQRAERELQADPLAVIDAELATLLNEADAMKPSLLGSGPTPVAAKLDAVEVRGRELVERAGKLGVPLDTLDLQASLSRGRFEIAVRQGDFESAAKQIKAAGRKGEAHVLKARLELARGRDPDPAWLQSWTTAEDEHVAEAARVLLAWQLAADDPRQALELIRERVSQPLADPLRARVKLVEAARQLDPLAVKRMLQDAGPRGAHSPRARRRALRDGLKGCLEPTVSPSWLLRVVQVVGLLRGDPGSQGPEFARTVLGIASLLEARLGEDDQTPRRLKTLVDLVEALGQTHLRPGPSYEAGLLLDGAVSHQPPLPRPALAKLVLGLAHLDLPLYAPHLKALPLEALAALAAQDRVGAVLLARARCAQGKASPRAILFPWLASTPKELGPVGHAQLLLEATEGLPAVTRKGHLEAALKLDPTSPWVLLESWRATSVPPQALQRASQGVRAALLKRKWLKPVGRALLESLAALQAEQGDKKAAAATRAERDRWFGR
jgi:hypothetical protein